MVIKRARPNDLCDSDDDSGAFTYSLPLLETTANWPTKRQKTDSASEAAEIAKRGLDPFSIFKCIGGGGQCDVFLGSDQRTKCQVAIKVGHAMNQLSSQSYQTHIQEWDMYMQLGALQGCPGKSTTAIAAVYAQGLMASRDPKNGLYQPWMAMQLLGRSVDNIVWYCGRDRTTMCRFGEQMLSALERCHSVGILHRDVKPGNFCLGDSAPGTAPFVSPPIWGRDPKEARALQICVNARSTFQQWLAAPARQVLLVDFGFAVTLPDGVLVHARFGGTPDYASTRSLNGGEVGAADDLESLGYTLLEMFTGAELPWDVTKKSEKKKEDMDSEDDSLEEQEDGWAAEDLRGFAQARDAAWEKQVQLKAVPSFLVTWIEETKTSHGVVPRYDVFRGLLRQASYESRCGIEE